MCDLGTTSKAIQHCLVLDVQAKNDNNLSTVISWRSRNILQWPQVTVLNILGNMYAVDLFFFIENTHIWKVATCSLCLL